MSGRLIYALDDEEDILQIIRINLEAGNYPVKTFSNPSLALEELNTGEIPALFILDIMMPVMDGYEFCKMIRSTKRLESVPVIFLSAKSDEFDKVLGLELGADDYITKPFSVKELVSRVKAVLRRMEPKTALSADIDADNNKLAYKGLELYIDQYRVNIDGTDVKLTKTEIEILKLFLKYRGKIFSRDNIIDSIRGNDVYVVDRTIDVHIMNLRKKLGKYKNVISTFSGVGYGFKENE
jgi:two-component system, OmpR family, alkaline phosphatase synthesis response regulator PhoP